MAYIAKDFGRRGLQHDIFSLIPLLVSLHSPHLPLTGSYDYISSSPSPHLAQEALRRLVRIRKRLSGDFNKLSPLPAGPLITAPLLRIKFSN